MKALIAAFFLGLVTTAEAQTIKFVTEEYPPYNFSTEAGPSGAAVDQIKLIMERLKQPYTIEVLPWARAFMLAETDPAYCVFTTGHDAERDGNFQWVEPLLIDHMVMVRQAGSAIAPKSLEDAQQYTVGTQREDFSASYLKEHRFHKIDYAANLDSSLKKLLAGRVDLLMTSEKTFESMRTEGKPVEAALVLEGKLYGIACHRDFPRDIVATMQYELDRLIGNGTQDVIFKQYGLKPNASLQAEK
ncbi:transporter substrate-binding domain-containing protein [Ensifer sp. PDNC004]|uniref:substrate-binding periplasmic protein n=1 Tax=Ensifer sp. PDNC004 TaxID=2811423 RepID=UPI001962EEE4|nr:transporter substrate-binding domain-containing protein [Ensifer sp. PDNC004]QRY68103.1 transporter substrate-binding domain-containing protein [Ensifer sp. PDNC004]